MLDTYHVIDTILFCISYPVKKDLAVNICKWIYIYIIIYIHMYTCLLDKPFLVMVGLNQASRSPTISSLHTIHLSNHLQLYPHHVWCSTHDHPVQQSDYLSIHTYLSFILNHPVFSSLAMARSCYCCLVKMGKDYPSYSAASDTCPEK